MARLILQSGCLPFNVYVGISEKIIRVIEYASRTCYDANDKATNTSWEKYIGARVKSGHESVIEHGLISVVIDTTVGYHDNDIKLDIDALNEALAKSNSLLHYVSESGWNPNEGPDQKILILSGNLKMWRDFMKYLCKNGYPHNAPSKGTRILKTLMKIFVFVDSTCRGIFTADIPELTTFNRGDVLDDPIRFFGGFDKVIVRMVRDWDETALINYDNLEMLYRSKMPTEAAVYGDEEDDPGEVSKLISMDNFGREFITAANLPPYLSDFVTAHTLDLNSVTYVIRMPRIVTQQEARHRVNSISQRSQRYVNEVLKDAEHYCPDTIDPDKIYHLYDDQTMTYKEFLSLSMQLYDRMIEDHIKKEDARLVLTGAIYSMMVVTKPFYTLPHYFKERCDMAAQKEIREPAIALRSVINTRFQYTVPENRKLL